MKSLLTAALTLVGTPSFAPVDPPTYRPTYPSPAEAAPSAQNLLDTQIGAGYRFRNSRSNFGGTLVEGWIDNELSGQGQIRLGNWLFNLSTWRYKAPLILPALPADQSNVASSEVNQISLQAGYTLTWQALEIAPSLFLTQLHVSSNGQGIPYSGTPMDWTQARRGIGLSLPVAFQLPGPFEIIGSLCWLPKSDIHLEKAPYGVTDTSFLESRIGLGIRLTPTLRGELTYARTLWQGGLNEDSDVFGLGITYRPERTGE